MSVVLNSRARHYTNAEETILSAANSQLSPEAIEDRIAMLCDHFGDDINARKLWLNLNMLLKLMNGKAAQQLTDVTNQWDAGIGSCKSLQVDCILNLVSCWNCCLL